VSYKQFGDYWKELYKEKQMYNYEYDKTKNILEI